ncbi:MAG: RIP metalloprotease RseP [Thermotogae bacterium]|nr:RIP metalloprotease RseP [Thermotogota bacterium]
MFEGLISIVAVLFGFSLLIVWHELGHLLAALSVGVKVEVFSIGFGHRLWGFKFKGIDFRVSAIPFGGYVRFSDEGAAGIPREFYDRPLWQRLWIAFAGPLFSFILGPILIAVALASTGKVSVMTTRIWRSHVVEFEDLDSVLTLNGEFLRSGERFLNLISSQGDKEVSLLRDGRNLEITVKRAIPPDSLEMRIPPVVGEVREGYPAAEAGLKVGDTIVSVDTLRIYTWQQLVEYVSPKGDGDTVILGVRRGGRTLHLKVGVRRDGDVGRIGVVVAYRTYPFSPPELLRETARLTLRFSVLLVDAVKKMVNRQVKVEEAVGGPITIGAAMATTAQQGIDRYFLLLALITLQLAVINLLPIPGLDGGHILFFIVDEMYFRIRGRRIPEKAHFWILMVGLSILITLAILVMGLDILKLLTGRLLPHR